MIGAYSFSGGRKTSNNRAARRIAQQGFMGDEGTDLEEMVLAIPPLEITLDYGDGSPALMLTKDNGATHGIWRHKYAQAGTYEITMEGI